MCDVDAVTVYVDGVGKCGEDHEKCRFVYAMWWNATTYNASGWFVKAKNATGQVVEKVQPENPDTARNGSAYYTVFTMNLMTRALRYGIMSHAISFHTCAGLPLVSPGAFHFSCSLTNWLTVPRVRFSCKVRSVITERVFACEWVSFPMCF